MSPAKKESDKNPVKIVDLTFRDGHQSILEQEQQAKVAIPQFQPTFEISPWRLYGRQESMRIRSHWRRQMRR